VCCRIVQVEVIVKVMKLERIDSVLRVFTSSFAKECLSSSVGKATLRSACPSEFAADGFSDVDGGVVKGSETCWMGNVTEGGGSSSCCC
jgi:hypothetical protein